MYNGVCKLFEKSNLFRVAVIAIRTCDVIIFKTLKLLVKQFEETGEYITNLNLKILYSSFLTSKSC